MSSRGRSTPPTATSSSPGRRSTSARLIASRHPIRHVRYELEEVGEPTIADVLEPIVAQAKAGRTRAGRDGVIEMTMTTTRSRDFTRLSDLSPEELGGVLELAELLKAEPAHCQDALRGETIACIFEKPSTRTRVSFAAAVARLGATPVALTPQELQLGRGETIADTARSLSGYCAAIVIRTFAQETVDELAHWASVPVVNALSDEHHPCQALADLLTVGRAIRRPARPAARLRRRRRRQRRAFAARSRRAHRPRRRRRLPAWATSPRRTCSPSRNRSRSDGRRAASPPRPARSDRRSRRRLRRRLGFDGTGGRT